GGPAALNASVSCRSKDRVHSPLHAACAGFGSCMTRAWVHYNQGSLPRFGRLRAMQSCFCRKPFTKNYGELICCHWAGSTLKWQRVSGIARVRLVLALGTAGRSTGVIDERLSEDSPRSLLTKVVGRVTAALLFATVLGQSDLARAAPQAAAADFTEA